MIDSNDKRHDPEGALLLIAKALRGLGEIRAPTGADAGTLEWVSRENERRSRLQKQSDDEEAAKRTAVGRYTLDGAARALHIEAGERYDVMLQRLLEAAANYNLPVYEPCKNARLRYGSSAGQRTRARHFHEEAHWDNLNLWLAETEPRITFRFPAPASTKVEENTIGTGALGLLGNEQNATPKAASAAAAQANPELDPARRLRALRELGGSLLWARSKWEIKRIGDLVRQEKAEGRPRSDQKTIRGDLHRAADDERAATRAGQAAAPWPN
jgi:hypothetical protein